MVANEFQVRNSDPKTSGNLSMRSLSLWSCDGAIARIESRFGPKHSIFDSARISGLTGETFETVGSFVMSSYLGPFCGYGICQLGAQAHKFWRLAAIENANSQDPPYTIYRTGNITNRLLLARDGTTKLAELHTAWRDSEAAVGCIGSFFTLVPREGDLYLCAVLFSAIEIIRDLCNERNSANRTGQNTFY